MEEITAAPIADELTIENSNAEDQTEDEAEIVSADYTPLLTSIRDKQQEQIALLQQQNEILLEQVNGLSYVVNYQNAFLGVAILAIVVFISYRVLFKWFFRGV
ncbi:MAG: hypothetical protein NC084_00075 [Bacteroides sp.]|nr:hypothetical protein [Eubacterium sp.]MCM1417297.1 hypothetical protein [Roseburia sp.]MCM1461083.1 hypothetical protein [Bacteroides sp.]